MITTFINIRVVDLIDILVVAFIMYQAYYLIKGTVAYNIFVGIISILLLYFFVDFLQMKLLSSILGALIGGGAIALIILFQQEIRRFLVFVGTRYFPKGKFNILQTLRNEKDKHENIRISSIHKACLSMAKTNTGAIIAISRESALDLYAETGDIINSDVSSRIIESIFMKNGPLHDGAVIISNNRIIAARCILPFTNQTELPPIYGMRHRAGIGISENTDAFVIMVSEERGDISVAENGQLIPNMTNDEFWHILTKRFGPAISS